MTQHLSDRTADGEHLSPRDISTVAIGVFGLTLVTVGPPAVAAVGCGLFGFAAFFRPWTTVPLIILTLPFYLRPRVVGTIEISTTEIAVITGVLCVLGRAAAERVRSTYAPRGGGQAPALPDDRGPHDGTGEEDHPPTQLATARGKRVVRAPAASLVDCFVAAFVVSGLLSLLVTEFPRQSLRELRWLIVEPVALMYVARCTLLRPAHVWGCLWSIVAAGMVAAIIGLGSLFVDGRLADPSVRSVAPYLSPNHLGLFLGRAASVGLALLLFGDGRRWSGAPLLIIAIGLLRTFSVGAWVGAAAAAIGLAAVRGRGWVAAVALALAVGAAVAVVVLPGERTVQRFDPSSGTGLFRLQIWTSSVHMLADHPLLGIGLDNFLYLYRREYMLPEAWEEPNISHPHNWVLNFWLNLGVLGLLSVLCLIAWTAAMSHRLFHRAGSRTSRLVGAAAGGLLLDTLVHGLFDNSYFLVDAAAIWWIAIGLVATCLAWEETHGGGQAPSLPEGLPAPGATHGGGQAPSLPEGLPAPGAMHGGGQAPSLPEGLPAPGATHGGGQAPSLPEGILAPEEGASTMSVNIGRAASQPETKP